MRENRSAPRTHRECDTREMEATRAQTIARAIDTLHERRGVRRSSKGKRNERSYNTGIWRMLTRTAGRRAP